MKKNLTELVFIIDKSGSMSGLESDTIGGFNAMLKEQQAVEGEAVVTTVLFDHELELLHDRINIKAVAPLTDKDYAVRGNTALLDAIGKTVNKVRAIQKHTAEEYRAEKVLFVIITDGHENASREYTPDWIKKRIERQKEKYGWEFIFIGANMDAVTEAGKLGIAADRAQNWCADGVGTAAAYTSMAQASTLFRKGKGLDGWAKQSSVSLNSAQSNHRSDVSQEDAKKALANLKKAFGGLKEAADELVDVVGYVQAHDGFPDADAIMERIFKEKSQNPEANGDDESRI